MSAFEDFVQLELPKRGYLNTDVSAETVIIRRGPGPRQFDAVTLAEGQVLGMVGGVLVGTSNSSLRKYVETISVASALWTIQHNLNSEDIIIQVFDENKKVLIPEYIHIFDANTVKIAFQANQTGVVRIVFLD